MVFCIACGTIPRTATKYVHFALFVAFRGTRAPKNYSHQKNTGSRQPRNVTRQHSAAGPHQARLRNVTMSIFENSMYEPMESRSAGDHTSPQGYIGVCRHNKAIPPPPSRRL
mmetsp:Transcript_22623/g.52217  ORF Transcript_22623/g.52217 Transcript_22623/m.52217 type:complete len:112 (+) Transcript_22623:722-1057(+)